MKYENENEDFARGYSRGLKDEMDGVAMVAFIRTTKAFVLDVVSKFQGDLIREFERLENEVKTTFTKASSE